MMLFQVLADLVSSQVRRGTSLFSPVLLALLAPSVIGQGTPFCFGDGSGTPCPCGNTSVVGANEGCVSSLGVGGRLIASGTPSIGADTLVLSGSQMPDSFALYFQGTSQQAGGAGGVFGDGLRCAAGFVIRLGTKRNAAGLSQYPLAGDPAISVRGLVASPGARTYQVWYRNAAAFCTASTFNLTNGLSVTWGFPTPPGMVAIPAGTFSMGSDAASVPPHYRPIGPVHDVTISYGFWMGQHEVTQAEYAALMGTNPSSFVGASRPVESVTWFNAQSYCAALTAQQGALGNVSPGYQYRLPTEAEWEYACRSGTTTEFNVGNALYCDQAQFFYSNDSNSICYPSGYIGTAPVASHSPNLWGLHDMHGNVWEWCLDSYDPYSAAPATDPFVTGGAYRVLRGGSWEGDSLYCRSAYRERFDPSSGHDSIGFRVVLAPILVP